jgi:hypothetical protein
MPLKAPQNIYNQFNIQLDLKNNDKLCLLKWAKVHVSSESLFSLPRLAKPFVLKMHHKADTSSPSCDSCYNAFPLVATLNHSCLRHI